jgi:hypothetical protein
MNTMTSDAFLARLRALYEIKWDDMPAFSDVDWYHFESDPGAFLANRNDPLAVALLRAIEARVAPEPVDAGVHPDELRHLRKMQYETVLRGVSFLLAQAAADHPGKEFGETWKTLLDWGDRVQAAKDAEGRT